VEHTTFTKAVVGRRGAWLEFVRAIRADHAILIHYSEKYRGAGRASGYLVVDLIRKIGVQMMFAYRVMRLLCGLRIPLLPQVVSRLVRHLYGADIHWNAEFEPGVMIVHGMGLCISHASHVGSGAILFQGVTLGEGADPDNGTIGSPRLERNVHIGPGATLIGPITVGASSKIMAGCVLTRSIPTHSVVEASTPVVRSRMAIVERYVDSAQAMHRVKEPAVPTTGVGGGCAPDPNTALSNR
jgi:serine O-acetyltransferase